MDRKRSFVSYLLLSGALGLGTWAAVVLPQKVATHPVAPTPPVQTVRPPQPGVARPQVDVVFVLDTTGSMSSLLDGAKKKVWEIARFIAQGQPAPDLRIGLIAYRDVTDDYVTKFFDLTDDLDGVYQNLTALSAAGGDDYPEHVAKALDEAVHKVNWSPRPNALKIIYLVGDAPPHTDYQDGFDFRRAAQQAKEKGIRINTLRCGSDADTEKAWLEIARRTGGDYDTIDQGGGVVEVATPFDADLARLNRALTETAIPYGSAEKRRTVMRNAEKNLEAPAAVQADRAGLFGAYRAKGRAVAVSDGDLLDDMAQKKVDGSKLESASLPEEMQGMNEADRERFIAGKKKARTEVLDQIGALNAKRDAYLRAAPAPAAGAGFDGKVRSSLKKQAADVGLLF